MTRISRRFRDLRDRGEKALILYLTAGDPSLEKTLEFIPVLEAAGADVLEIGVPFSDPSGLPGPPKSPGWMGSWWWICPWKRPGN
jgi:tryptophan synthase alpha subunit